MTTSESGAGATVAEDPGDGAEPSRHRRHGADGDEQSHSEDGSAATDQAEPASGEGLGSAGSAAVLEAGPQPGDGTSGSSEAEQQAGG